MKTTFNSIEEVIADIELNRRDLSIVELQYVDDRWWITLRKGNLQTPVAIHTNLVFAYEKALQYFDFEQRNNK